VTDVEQVAAPEWIRGRKEGLFATKRMSHRAETAQTKMLVCAAPLSSFYILL